MSNEKLKFKLFLRDLVAGLLAGATGLLLSFCGHMTHVTLELRYFHQHHRVWIEFD